MGATAAAAAGAGAGAAGAGAGAAGAGVSAATSMFLTVGVGVGGVFVAVAAIFLLAYLDLLNAAEIDPEIKKTAVVSVGPVVFTFGAVVLYHALTVYGVL